MGGRRPCLFREETGRQRGEPPEGTAGLLRQTGGSRPDRASFTDQCAPSKGQGAERHDPFPGLFQKGYGAAGGHRLERLEKSVRNSSGRCSERGFICEPTF